MHRINWQINTVLYDSVSDRFLQLYLVSLVSLTVADNEDNKCVSHSMLSCRTLRNVHCNSFIPHTTYHNTANEC